MTPPDFGRSVNPISTDRLFPPNNTGTPGFLDLPTAEYKKRHAKTISSDTEVNS